MISENTIIWCFLCKEEVKKFFRFVKKIQINLLDINACKLTWEAKCGFT